MNEDFIRTFANQASEYAEGLELNQGELTPELLKARDLKLAELIVRECAVWMENATVTDSAGNKDHIGDSFFWADELKKHFGVEE